MDAVLSGYYGARERRVLGRGPKPGRTSVQRGEGGRIAPVHRHLSGSERVPVGGRARPRSGGDEEPRATFLLGFLRVQVHPPGSPSPEDVASGATYVPG